MSKRSPAGLQCAYLTPDAFDRRLARQASSMLGGVCFMQAGGGRSAEAGLDRLAIPLAQISMPPLGSRAPAASLYEVWLAEGDIVRGSLGPVHYSYNDELLYGVIRIDEEQFEGGQQQASSAELPLNLPLQLASKRAYAALFATADALGYPAVLRIWNYIAGINVESFGVERYRQFNTGRQDGFLASGRAVSGSVPAASAVGMRDGPLTICFLASRGAVPTPIENPRQVSAYQYPQQYGATSPTFSRASVAPLAGSDVLFLSGTASIVGHQTLHVGDIVAQAGETVVNISAILDEANRVRPGLSLSLADLCCKVYVRDPADVALLEAALRAMLGPAPVLLYVQADICRAGLAMEIEATAGHPVAFLA